jgi:hypothetical protein
MRDGRGVRYALARGGGESDGSKKLGECSRRPWLSHGTVSNIVRILVGEKEAFPMYDRAELR